MLSRRFVDCNLRSLSHSLSFSLSLARSDCATNDVDSFIHLMTCWLVSLELLVGWRRSFSIHCHVASLLGSRGHRGLRSIASPADRMALAYQAARVHTKQSWHRCLETVERNHSQCSTSKCHVYTSTHLYSTREARSAVPRATRQRACVAAVAASRSEPLRQPPPCALA